MIQFNKEQFGADNRSEEQDKSPEFGGDLDRAQTAESGSEFTDAQDSEQGIQSTESNAPAASAAAEQAQETAPAASAESILDSQTEPESVVDQLTMAHVKNGEEIVDPYETLNNLIGKPQGPETKQ